MIRRLAEFIVNARLGIHNWRPPAEYHSRGFMMLQRDFSARRPLFGSLGRWRATTVVALLLSVAATTARAQEYISGIEWQEPAVVTPSEKCGDASSDAVVLFEGKNFDAWKGAEEWKIEDGAMVVGKNMIESKEAFGDCQLHIEWSAPTPPAGEGQGRGNSGLFFGPYELQVLDSYKSKTYFDGQAASIYKQRPPMVNAMRPPGEWNVYDVIWTAPRFKEDGALESPAFITVLHNGVVVQNHFQLEGNTPYSDPPSYTKHDVKQPIRLQDHGNPVRFRNIWVRETTPAQGKRTREPFRRDGDKETPVK